MSELLVRGTPYLEAALLAAGGWALWKVVPKVSRRGWALALALTAAALGLRLLQPATHQVFYDEYEHADISAHVASSWTFAATKAGGLPGTDLLARPTWPGLYHVTAGVLGGGEKACYALSLFAGTATVLLLFLAGVSLNKNEQAGLLAAALWAALPLAIRYSRTTELTAFSGFWIAAVFLGMAARKTGPLIVLLACACHARFENTLLIPLAMGWVGWRCGLAALLALPAWALAWLNHAEGVKGFAEGTALSQLAAQGPGNLLWLLSGAALVVTAVAALGKERRPLLAAAGYFLAASAFYRGSFHAPSDDRYASPVLLSLALTSPAVPWWPAPALAMALFKQPPPSAPEQLRAYEKLKEWTPLLPEDSYTLCWVPAFARVATGRPAASVTLLTEPGVRKRLDERGGMLLLDWWWRRKGDETARILDELSKTHTFSTAASGEGLELLRLTPRLRAR